MVLAPPGKSVKPTHRRVDSYISHFLDKLKEVPLIGQLKGGNIDTLLQRKLFTVPFCSPREPSYGISTLVMALDGVPGSPSLGCAAKTLERRSTGPGGRRKGSASTLVVAGRAPEALDLDEAGVGA